MRGRRNRSRTNSYEQMGIMRAQRRQHMELLQKKREQEAAEEAAKEAAEAALASWYATNEVFRTTYETHEKTSCNGSSLWTNKSDNIDECRKECDQLWQCKAFTYDDTSKNCELKSDRNITDGANSLEATTCNVSLPNSYEEKRKYMDNKYQTRYVCDINNSIQLDEIKEVRADPWARDPHAFHRFAMNCKKECEKNENCTAISFGQQNWPSLSSWSGTLKDELRPNNFCNLFKTCEPKGHQPIHSGIMHVP